jgi:hypothetical protein
MFAAREKLMDFSLDYGINEYLLLKMVQALHLLPSINYPIREK